VNYRQLERNLFLLGPEQGIYLKITQVIKTISDINSLHNVLDELQQRNSDVVHSSSHQVTYIKKLDATAEINTNAIANLSNIIKHNMIQSHDKFQRITRDVMWLNLTLHGQSELHTVVRQSLPYCS
jgi:hypothetical protein